MFIILHLMMIFECLKITIKLCVFVYCVDDDNSIRSEYTGNLQLISNDVICLLRVNYEEKSHYIYIKHIERLLNLHHQLIDKDKRFCPMCNGKKKYVIILNMCMNVISLHVKVRC